MFKSIGYGAYGQTPATGIDPSKNVFAKGTVVAAPAPPAAPDIDIDAMLKGNLSGFSGFGYIGGFGKAAVVPAPAAPGTTPDIVIEAEADDEEDEVDVKASPKAIAKAKGQPFMDPEMAALQAAIAAARARKQEQEEAMRAYQEKLAKQAAYGRDTVQARPKEAGYATEAERLMGGRTGYTSSAGFGQIELDQATKNIELATKAVKQIQKDVKAGIATKADLQAAINDLKIKMAAVRSSGLGGFGEGFPIKKWAVYGAIAVAAYFLYKRIS